MGLKNPEPWATMTETTTCTKHIEDTGQQHPMIIPLEILVSNEGEQAVTIIKMITTTKIATIPEAAAAAVIVGPPLTAVSNPCY